MAKAGPGRPRKPAAVKIAEGTYRPDRDGPLDQVVQAEGEPVAPAHLDAFASLMWQQVVPGLVATGVAKACDTTELAMMCEWYSRYRRIGAELDAAPPASTAVGRLVYAVGVAWTNFDRIASRFGLTPSDRAKLRVTPATGCKMSVPPRKRG